MLKVVKKKLEVIFFLKFETRSIVEKNNYKLKIKSEADSFNFYENLFY